MRKITEKNAPDADPRAGMLKLHHRKHVEDAEDCNSLEGGLGTTTHKKKIKHTHTHIHKCDKRKCRGDCQKPITHTHTHKHRVDEGRKTGVGGNSGEKSKHSLT